jgi:hypothetical protein
MRPLHPRVSGWFGGAVAALAAVGLVPGEVFAQPPERLPAGSLVARVAVGGLGPSAVKRELRRVLRDRYERPVAIRVRRTRRLVPTRRAGHTIDYGGMVARAFSLAAEGRRVDVPLRRSIAGKALSAAVRALARPWYRAPRNARARFGLRRVARIRGRVGRRLDTRGLRRRLLRELRKPTAARAVRAGLRRVKPAVTGRELRRVYATYVSIDRRGFTLRLFKRLRIARRYPIAVGAAGYETPAGLRRVVSKQVNPAWRAPNRPWAGSLAGKTIPPGDPRNPLKARWMGLGGGVGIHGTAEEWSIGTRASHGCLRMRVSDVKRLYARVPLGTPVLIR